MNLKGTSSFQPIDGKPGFRVNINKFVSGAKFFGLKEFLLNNMTTDPSMLRERLAYWIGRQIGSVPTSRCNHSWVTLNGAPLGLYATVEEPKDQLMARYFPDATGPVYTINYADFQPAYLSAFELQDGTNDLSLINGATTALQMTPADTAIAAAGQFVNLHEFERYWALMVLTGHWGGWPYAPDPRTGGRQRRHLRRSHHPPALLHPRGDQRRVLDGGLRLHQAGEVGAGRELRGVVVVLSGLFGAAERARRDGHAAQLVGRDAAGGGADRPLRCDGPARSPTATTT